MAIMNDYPLKKKLVRKGFWNKVKEQLRHAPFLEEALAAYYCAFDKATPLSVKATLIGALAYFILPTDLIPDFITGFGLTDDAAVLFAAIRAVRPHVKNQHRRKAQKKLNQLLNL